MSNFLRNNPLSNRKELAKKVKELVEQAYHGESGMKTRTLGFHGDQAAPEVNHGSHCIFDSNGL